MKGRQELTQEKNVLFRDLASFMMKDEVKDEITKNLHLSKEVLFTLSENKSISTSEFKGNFYVKMQTDADRYMNMNIHEWGTLCQNSEQVIIHLKGLPHESSPKKIDKSTQIDEDTDCDTVILVADDMVESNDMKTESMEKKTTVARQSSKKVKKPKVA